MTPEGNKPIGHLKDGDIVKTIDPVTLKSSFTKIHHHFIVDSEKTGGKMIEIETISGRIIQSTSDHKFLTNKGWKQSGCLTENDLVCIHPDITNLNNNVVLDSEIISHNGAVNFLINLGISDTLSEKHVDNLMSLNLIPLKTTNKKI